MLLNVPCSSFQISSTCDHPEATGWTLPKFGSYFETDDATHVWREYAKVYYIIRLFRKSRTFLSRSKRWLVRAGKDDWSRVFIVFSGGKRKPGKCSLRVAEVPEGLNLSWDPKEERSQTFLSAYLDVGKRGRGKSDAWKRLANITKIEPDPLSYVETYKISKWLGPSQNY